MSLFEVRFGFVAIFLTFAGLCVWRYRSVIAAFEEFFEPVPAINLGLLRVFIFSILVLGIPEAQAPWYTSLDVAFLNVPHGWGWLREFMPLSPQLMRGLELSLYVSGVLAALGLFSRITCLVAALLALVVLGVNNFYFKIGHGMHVPVLTAMVIAAAPSGDALSVDALIRRFRKRPPYAPHVAYTLPVRFAWLLAGTMYLFPGLAKLWDSGDQWVDGTKLLVELLNKWSEMPDFYPPFRADKWPVLLAVFGTLTLIVEIGFFPAMFQRTARVIAGLAACGFHVGVGFVMNIWFNPLHPLIVLFDLPKLAELWPIKVLVAPLRRLFARAPARVRDFFAPSGVASEPRPRAGYWAAATTVAGGTFVLCMFVAGLAPFDSWPIGSYPRFADRASGVPSTASRLSFAVRGANGIETGLASPFAKLRDDAAAYGIIKKSLRMKGNRRKAGQLKNNLALLSRLVHESSGPFKPGDTLLIYSIKFPIDPDERKQSSPSPKLEFELEL